MTEQPEREKSSISSCGLPTLQQKKPINQKPGNHPNFKKEALGVKKAILGALGEFPGILGAALGVQKIILGMRNPILGMASHDLSNEKTTILGATPGAIPRIDGNPRE